MEEEGFSGFLNYVEPRYKPPHRTTFSSTHMPNLYNEVFESIKVEVGNAKNISITTDIWTANPSTNFISLTAHWLSEMFYHKVAVLDARPFPGHHTAVHIQGQIESGLSKFEIPKECVVCCVTDGCANMVAGTRLTGMPHLTCFIPTPTHH